MALSTVSKLFLKVRKEAQRSKVWHHREHAAPVCFQGLLWGWARPHSAPARHSGRGPPAVLLSWGPPQAALHVPLCSPCLSQPCKGHALVLLIGVLTDTLPANSPSGRSSKIKKSKSGISLLRKWPEKISRIYAQRCHSNVVLRLKNWA